MAQWTTRIEDSENSSHTRPTDAGFYLRIRAVMAWVHAGILQAGSAGNKHKTKKSPNPSFGDLIFGTARIVAL